MPHISELSLPHSVNELNTQLNTSYFFRISFTDLEPVLN